MSSTPPQSHPPTPPRNPSYNSLPSTLTSALSWTFKALTSPSTSPPTHAPTHIPPRAPSPVTPPPLPPLRISSSRLLSRTLAEEIRLLLPPRLQLHDTWRLAYSLSQHGVSLATLYERSAVGRGAGSVGFVLVVRDSLGGVGSPPPPKHIFPPNRANASR